MEEDKISQDDYKHQAWEMQETNEMLQDKFDAERTARQAAEAKLEAMCKSLAGFNLIESEQTIARLRVQVEQLNTEVLYWSARCKSRDECFDALLIKQHKTEDAVERLTKELNEAKKLEYVHCICPERQALKEKVDQLTKEKAEMFEEMRLNLRKISVPENMITQIMNDYAKRFRMEETK